MRGTLRWWPAALAAALVALSFAGRPIGAFDKDQDDQDQGGQRLDRKKVSAALKTVINRGVDMYRAGDHAGCYRYYQGCLTTLRPLLGRYPKTQKAIDNGLARAERDPTVWRRCLILRAALDRTYRQFTPSARVRDKAGRDVKDEGRGRRRRPRKDERGDDKPRKARDKKTKPPKDDANQNNEDQNSKDAKKRDKKDGRQQPFEVAKKVKVKVSGKVLFRGQPLASGTVKLIAEVGKFSATTKVYKDGTYSFKAVPPGTYKVVVKSTQAKFPAAYADPKRSPLKVQVGNEDQQYDLQIN
jgi:hypothetical protein